MIDIIPPKEISTIKDRKKKKRDRRRLDVININNASSSSSSTSNKSIKQISTSTSVTSSSSSSNLENNNNDRPKIFIDSNNSIINNINNNEFYSSSLTEHFPKNVNNNNNNSNNNTDNNNKNRMEIDLFENPSKNNNDNNKKIKELHVDLEVEEDEICEEEEEEEDEEEGIEGIESMDIDNNWYSGDPLVSEVLKDEKETLGLIEKKKLELQSVQRTIWTLEEAKGLILKDLMIKKQYLKNVQKKKEDQIKTISNSYHSIALKYNLSQVESRSLTLILPEEVMLHIFKHLSPLDICKGVCRVSQKWRSLAFDICLWRDICHQRRLLDGSEYYLPSNNSSTTTTSNDNLSESCSSISSSLSSSTGSMTSSSSSSSSSSTTTTSTISSTSTINTRPYGENWYVGEFRKDSNWRKGKYSTTVIRDHKEIVWSLLFESESNTLISGSEDMTVKVWDCNGLGGSRNNGGVAFTDDVEDSKKRCIKTLTGHKNGTICLGSTPTRLVSGSADGTLKIWDRQEGTCIETIQTHSSVWCLQIMDNQLICGCVDGTMRVFDLNTSNCLRTMRGHTAPVRCLQAVNHNGQDVLISGSYDKTIKIWDMNSVCTNTIRAHTHKINCIQYENGQLVSGSHDSLLKIWDMNGGLTHTLQGHDNMIHCLQFKGNKLLSGSTDSTIRLWDLKTGTHVNTIKGQSAVCCLKFDDSKLITGYEDSTIKVFDFSY